MATHSAIAVVGGRILPGICYYVPKKAIQEWHPDYWRV